MSFHETSLSPHDLIIKSFKNSSFNTNAKWNGFMFKISLLHSNMKAHSLLYSSYYTLYFLSFPNCFCSKMNMALNLMVHFGILLVVWTTSVNGWFTTLFLRVVKVFYMALQINLLFPWTHVTQITHPLLPNFFLFFPMNALFGYWIVGVYNK